MTDAVNPEIAFVYFDLGNMLLSFDADVACANLAKLFGVSPEQALAALYHSGLEDRFEHGELSPQQFAAELSRALEAGGRRPPPAEILDAISDMFTPIQAMTGVMSQVHRGGRAVGILSNTCHAHWDWVRRQAYDVMVAQLDVTILSFEVGAMKPDPRIYLAAEQAAGVPANQILFLDDKPENVDAAARRGWHAEVCLGGPQTLTVLRQYGVHP